MSTRLPGVIAAVLVVCSVAACGGGPSGPSSDGATITIERGGVSPTSVRVSAPTRVTFVNNDTRPHTMVSDPVGIHTDCPAVNDVGFLAPGARRVTGTLNDIRVCGFHDHSNQTDTALQGHIVVQ